MSTACRCGPWERTTRPWPATARSSCRRSCTPRSTTRLKHYGPLADDSLITVLRIGFGAKLDITTANSLVKATVVGAGTDGTLDQQDTGDVNYTPHKYHKQVGIVSELMLDDYVNFETWVNGSVSEAFGGAFNDDRTLGNGTSKMTGAFAGTSSATNSHQIAANTSISEDDVLAMLKLLDYAYQQLPGCRIMMHASTELDLMAQRKSGQRVYDLNPSTRRLILPRGLPYAVNNAFATARDSNTNKLIGIGDFGRYVSVYGGGMRVNSEYISRSDEFLLTWYCGGGRRADARRRVPVDPGQGLAEVRRGAGMAEARGCGAPLRQATVPAPSATLERRPRWTGFSLTG